MEGFVEGFVIRQNIEHFRRILAQTSNEGTRRQVLQLLREEEEKLARSGNSDGGGRT